MTCKTENQMIIVKSLTPGGGGGVCRPKELRLSSQYIDHRKDPCGCKVESKGLRNKKRCYCDRGVYGAVVAVGKTGLALR